MKSKPLLERWYQFHDTMVGYIFDSKEFRAGARVQTGCVVWFDPANREVRCRDGEYRLGEPGTYQEHNVPLKDGVWKRPLLQRLGLR